MTIPKKQMKLPKMFHRAANRVPQDCEELDEEIQQLQQKLRHRQDELFQLQRNSFRQQPQKLKKKFERFVRPEKIVLTNAVETLKRKLELMSMLSGIEVHHYQVDELCNIVYHMQHHTEHEIKHGLLINLKNGINEVTKSSLPVGFKLSEVLDNFENVMLPECLISVRRALVAYYDRLEQFDNLKRMLIMEAQLFKILDGSHIEVKFWACNQAEAEDEPIDVTLMLDYRIYDIRPKQLSFIELDLPEGASQLLKSQCVIFRKKPLHNAFKEAFIDGNGTYIMVQQTVQQPIAHKSRRKQKRSRPNPQYNRYDDTFHPDDCSESDDDVHE